jgi:histidine triad (HIT) family protein
MTDCIFCGIVAGTVPATVLGESDLALAFSDLAPQAPLHALVVPKRHLDNAAEITAEDGPVLAEMAVLARTVAADAGYDHVTRGYRLIMNVGPDSLNSVPHLHLHVLAGRSMDWPPG